MQKFITDYSQLSNSGKIIILIWIPSHIGVKGNELADEAAKSDGCVSNKYGSVKHLLAAMSSLSSLSRQDAVVLRRLRIGHTRLTHSYLLNRQDQPECSHCDFAW